MAFADTIRRLARERFAERSHAALRDLFWSVRPVFWPDDRDEAELIGSSLLFRVDGRHFLITAAHVLDFAHERTLYIGARDSLYELEGHRKHTTPPSGGTREDDRLDLCFMELSDPLVSALSECRFLELPDVAINEQVDVMPGAHSDYLAIGFPATKVKRSLADRKITPEPLVYSSHSLPLADYSELGVAEYSHIVVAFDRKNVANILGRMTAPDPHGMSGGGLWRFDSLRGGKEDRNLLVGVLIEYHQKRIKGMLATRISLCLEGLRAAYPELASAIPRARRVNVTTHIAR